MLLAALIESKFALSVLQKLDHCSAVTNNFFFYTIADSESIFIFRDIGA